MSIEQLRSVAAVQQEPASRQRNVPSVITSLESSSDAGTQVKFSQLTQQVKTDTSQDINMDRVNDLKAKIAEGKLTIDTHKIASRLVENIFNV